MNPTVPINLFVDEDTMELPPSPEPAVDPQDGLTEVMATPSDWQVRAQLEYLPPPLDAADGGRVAPPIDLDAATLNAAGGFGPRSPTVRQGVLTTSPQLRQRN